jgi:hypothetical protein
MRRLLVAAAFVALSGTATAQPASPSPAPDYAKPESWLCLPGRAADACSADQAATVVAADGAATRENFRGADANAPIDCFYVYPTVSNDPTGNSDMTANAEEQYVIANQFARFASVCRPFAPLYRQFTLTALRALMTGQPITADRMMAFTDVRAAWNEYLEKHNNGRGVVLIGHSQGAGLLTGLVAAEIDGKPVQSKIVAAYLLGSNVIVPRGKAVGGVFRSMPLCERADQTGCVVAFASFRDTIPPPANSRFGTTQMNSPIPLPAGDMSAACVNPAALLAEAPEAAPLNAYLSNRGALGGVENAPRVWATGKTIETPFVRAPGLLTGRCVSTPTHTYLSVRVNADRNDPRTDDIPGDVLIGGQVQPDWGLHLIDVSLTMGDLVALAARQGAAWKSAQ